MEKQIIKDLMEVIHDAANIKGKNEALKKENEFLRGLITKQFNILPDSNNEVVVCDCCRFQIIDKSLVDGKCEYCRSKQTDL